MSQSAWQQTDDKATKSSYNPEAPEGQVKDNESYLTSKNEPVPVQGDSAQFEDPIKAESADSDKQLEQDDKEAIDKSNIMKDRTRGAQPAGSYQEPSDDQMGLME
ncbi:hypothetical protein PT974_07779 [Cladobotryum mycophilum]|uniref:Uncharacterized protein n=1 Tax=Cladobotryum mycophilum TaxID=491253 RepID=A0ABR0SJ16_9HYPO